MGSTDLEQRTKILSRYLGIVVSGFEIRFKDEGYKLWWERAAASIMRFFYAILSFMTRGGFKRDFDRDYVTVFGPRVYFPSRQWMAASSERAYRVLRHEAVHLNDRHKYGVWFGLSYLVVLPAIWTMRYRWELRAYSETMLVYHEMHGDLPDEYVEGIVDILCSPGYLWMTLSRKKARADCYKVAKLIREQQYSSLIVFDGVQVVER